MSKSTAGGVGNHKAGLLEKKWFIPVMLFMLVELLVLLGIFLRPEMALYDTWFRLRGVQPPGDQVVIVSQDEPSITRLGPPPWPRSLHALLLDKLGQAKVVGFDLLFDAPSTPENDQAFATAVKKHGRVVLASQFSFEKDEKGEIMQVLQMPIEKLRPGLAGLGFVNTPTDPDHVVRHMTLVDVNTFDTPFPSFGMAIAFAAEGLNPAQINLASGQLTIGKQKIALAAANQAMPNFWGPGGTFKTISYVDVIEGKVSSAYFKDKIVMVGPTSAAFHDEYPTPCTTSNMIKTGSLPTPGVEIHASVVNSFLQGSWFRPANVFINLLFLLLFGFITALFVARRGPWRGLAGTLVVVAIAAGIVIALWYQHIWLNLAAPLALIFLTYVVVTATDFIRAEKARRKTKAMFARYVSADVVEELIKNPDEAALGGKKQVVTVMFADIRGFTAYSENKDPLEVISRLNEYLTVMTESIQRHGGTLDKYLGDGLMAFFGAPLFYEDHAERAIKVAIEIQQAVEQLNQAWAVQEAVPLKVAVGINTGPVVVGNVGSPERMDYTLIGEDVNLASRVEALSKLFETLIVISERSYNLLPKDECQDSLYYLGEELVKGFTNPIKCYSVKDMDLHFEKSTDKGFK